MSTVHTKPKVSIITLNWNGTDVTCSFLESSRNLLYPNYEILVCDMNSLINPQSQINAGHYPQTKVLVSSKNLGFAAGNNWGIKQASGDYFFIVNNDTELTPGIIDELLEPFYEDASIGVTCPKIKYFSHPDTIQYAGFEKMNMYTGRTHSIGDKQKDTGQYNTPGYTNGAHGCAMMVKKEVIEKTGMFPGTFFLYYEEWDWSMRIMNAGYKIYYQPQAVIYHKESMSVGKDSTLKTYYLNRNRILFMRRNCSFPQLLIFSLFYSIFSFPKIIFHFIIQRKPALLKAYLKAVWWNLTHKST